MKTGRGYVYDLYYHIVWCVKYRHKITYLKIQKKLLTGKTKIFVKNEWVSTVFLMFFGIISILK